MFLKPPLIPLNEDYKWRLLAEILNIFDLRSTKQILAQHKILPLEKSIPVVVRKLEDKKKSQKFMKIRSVPSENEVYSILSSFDPDKFINFVVGLLKNVCSRRKRGLNQIIIDGTGINLDFNWFNRKISKKMLENRDFKWGHSTHSTRCGIT